MKKKFHVTDEMYCQLVTLVIQSIQYLPIDVSIELDTGDTDVFLHLSSWVSIERHECPDVVLADINSMYVRGYDFSVYPMGDDTDELENDFDINKLVKEFIGRQI